MSPLNSEERRRMDQMEMMIQKIDSRQDRIEDDIKTIKSLSKGLLIGIVIAAFLFGYLNFAHLQDIAKMIK